MSGSNLLETFKSKMPNTGFLIKLGYMPDTPVNCIALNSSGGEDPVRFFGQERQLEYPIVSVRVRSEVYDTGYDACTAVRDTMKNVHDDDFLGVKVMQNVTDLGRDENNRNYFEIIFKVTIEE